MIFICRKYDPTLIAIYYYCCYIVIVIGSSLLGSTAPILLYATPSQFSPLLGFSLPWSGVKLTHPPTIKQAPCQYGIR
jgi:hypothetical protein